jgi:transglutaminase-like putative cysteine protease
MHFRRQKCADRALIYGRCIVKKMICAALLLFVGFSASSAGTYRPGYTVLRSVVQYDVKADGRYSEDLQEDLRLNTQSGVDDLSQYSIRFSSALQSVKVLEAYTLTLDGRRLLVKPENMLLQQSSESADAPMFDDSKVLNVVFPALAPGVTVHIHFVRTQRVALFPGVFALQVVYSQLEDRDSSELVIRAPASLPLQVDNIDVPGGEVKADKPGMRRWLWKMGPHRAEVPENDAISDVDYSPRLGISSLASYDALAQAYVQRAAPKAAVTPAIRALASQITAGVVDPRAQAEVLYRWVSQNIRYVGIYFGFGGVVPHSAEQIAHALYGDCKDHVTLYQALLAARGIASSPVLVNADQSWWLSRAAVPTGAFNHAISYLPQWDVFVDTTAQFAPFGVLPENEAGKRVLVMDPGPGKPRLMTLPLTRPETDRLQVRSDMSLSGDGAIKGKSQVQTQGIYDYMTRSAFSVVTPGTEDGAVSRLLSSRGMQGSGTLALGNSYDLSRAFSYQLSFDLPDYADLSGPTGVVLPSGQESVFNLAVFASWGGAAATRRYPMMLNNGLLEETTHLKLPPSVHLLALPRRSDLISPLGSYHADYRYVGGEVEVHRVLELSGNHPLLAPERYLLLRQLARTVARDLRSQVLLQPN